VAGADIGIETESITVGQIAGKDDITTIVSLEKPVICWRCHNFLEESLSGLIHPNCLHFTIRRLIMDHLILACFFLPPSFTNSGKRFFSS